MLSERLDVVENVRWVLNCPMELLFASCRERWRVADSNSCGAGFPQSVRPRNDSWEDPARSMRKHFSSYLVELLLRL